MVKGLQGLDRGEMNFPICLTPAQDPVKWQKSKYLLSPFDWILHRMAANGKITFFFCTVCFVGPLDAAVWICVYLLCDESI